MDPLASYAVTKEAADRARRNEDDSPVDAPRPPSSNFLSTGFGAHTTADDPTAYRDPDAVDPWRALDPLDRMEAFLRETGRIDDDGVAAIHEEADGSSPTRSTSPSQSSPIRPTCSTTRTPTSRRNSVASATSCSRPSTSTVRGVPARRVDRPTIVPIVYKYHQPPRPRPPALYGTLDRRPLGVVTGEDDRALGIVWVRESGVDARRLGELREADPVNVDGFQAVEVAIGVPRFQRVTNVVTETSGRTVQRRLAEERCRDQGAVVGGVLGRDLRHRDHGVGRVVGRVEQYALPGLERLARGECVPAGDVWDTLGGYRLDACEPTGLGRRGRDDDRIGLAGRAVRQLDRGACGVAAPGPERDTPLTCGPDGFHVLARLDCHAGVTGAGRERRGSLASPLRERRSCRGSSPGTCTRRRASRSSERSIEDPAVEGFDEVGHVVVGESPVVEVLADRRVAAGKERALVSLREIVPERERPELSLSERETSSFRSEAIAAGIAERVREHRPRSRPTDRRAGRIGGCRERRYRVPPRLPDSS